MLRYFAIAESDFAWRSALLILPGVKRNFVAISADPHRCRARSPSRNSATHPPRSWLFGRGNLELREFDLRHLSQGQLVAAHREGGDVVFAELFEGQIHVTEEFVLLLLAVFEIVQAAACAEQDALAAQRPQRFFHKAEIIYEKLAAVHRNARKAVIGAEMADGELAPGALVPVKRERRVPSS